VTNVLLNITLYVFLKVLPPKEISCLVNAVIASYRIVVVLYKDVVFKGKVFRNLHFPVPA
jgi:hypothetical protein